MILVKYKYYLTCLSIYRRRYSISCAQRVFVILVIIIRSDQNLTIGKKDENKQKPHSSKKTLYSVISSYEVFPALQQLRTFEQLITCNNFNNSIVQNFIGIV